MLWLLSLLIIAHAFLYLAFGQIPLIDGSIDIHLHDTYLTLSGSGIFFFVAILIYLVKETVRRFSSIPGNIILALLLLAGLFLLFQLHKFYFFLQLNGGATVYPPLSSLPNQYEPVANAIDTSTEIFLISTEVALTGFIYFLGYKTGRLSKTAL